MSRLAIAGVMVTVRTPKARMYRRCQLREAASMYRPIKPKSRRGVKSRQGG